MTSYSVIRLNLSEEPSIFINIMKFLSIFSFKNKKKKSKAENKVLSLVDDVVSPPQISNTVSLPTFSYTTKKIYQDSFPA